MYIYAIHNCIPIRYNEPMESNLLAILSARDARAARQKRLQKAYPGAALLCLTVNLPGPEKRTPDGDRVFQAGLSALNHALAQTDIPLRHMELHRRPTGNEGYFLLSAAPERVKEMACQLEDSLPFGRLLDADVLSSAGIPMSRSSLGLASRCCLVCGREGAFCASRRAHPLPELLAAFHKLAETCPEESRCSN